MTCLVRGHADILLRSSEDVAEARSASAQILRRVGAGPRPTSRVVTIVSELARNALVHGGGGAIAVSLVRCQLAPRGVRIAVEDGGPGIADPERAMVDGFSTKGGLGLGLSGSVRLADSLEIRRSRAGGAHVTAWVWL